jgi:hypothetical protein
LCSAKEALVLLANVGLPMIFIELPFLAMALVPVTLVEAAVYRWWLSMPWRQSIWGALRANLWSTFVGIPLAWLAQVVFQLAFGGGSMWGLDTPLDRLAAVTLQSAWLIPYEGEFRWMVPAAALSLLVPFLLVSIVVEYFLLRRYWPGVVARRLVTAVVLANLVSYLLLAAFWGVRLSIGLAARTN